MNVGAHGFTASIAERVRNAPDRLLPVLCDRGGSRIRIMAQREIGVRLLTQGAPRLVSNLESPIPGLRRSSAWALGRLGEPSFRGMLFSAACKERVDAARFQMAVAAVACGEDRNKAFDVLWTAANRTLCGAYGERHVGGYAGYGSTEIRQYWDWSNRYDDTQHIGHSRAPAREVCDFEGEREAVLAKAIGGLPDDFDALATLWRTAGRRMRLTLTAAKGLHGDPRWVPSLLQSLFSTDIDPGHGFALRAESARALGRIGVPSVVPLLKKAIDMEALDQEGRPGSGLGIQRSVRETMLAALGELQAGQSITMSYLGNTHSSASGGLYLPAMDALWKSSDVSLLRRLAVRGDLVGQNASGVISALSL